MKYKIILTTCPDLPTAHQIAEDLLEQDLVACVNLFPSVVSLYKWQGKVEQSMEIQLFLKTIERNIGKIESYINQHHPYDVPEFLVVDIDKGSPAYLSWLSDATNAANK